MVARPAVGSATQTPSTTSGCWLDSQSRTNDGGFSDAPFDQLIERARRADDGRVRPELFHEADRIAVADQVAVIPIYYVRGLAYVQPWVQGWWEFGKSSASLANLAVADRTPP